MEPSSEQVEQKETMTPSLEQVGPSRCGWAATPLLVAYHDHEWGTRPDSDARWFEFLILEMFQSGLSWRTILQKREAFRAAFAEFSLQRVYAFTPADIERCMGDTGIVRNRRKIVNTVYNAGQALTLCKEYGSLAAYFSQPGDEAYWQKAIGETFRGMGRTTTESFLFATGIVTPAHEERCFLHRG